MAKGYRPVDRDQVFLLPPDMREWLPDGHPVWLVIDALGQMDTSAFHAGRRVGGAGAAGYDPDMLLGVLVWAYAHRETSSRRMEGLCATDVAFRVICGGNLPDHSTIARFRKDFGEAVPGFFAQVLILCARLGMGRLGTVALDGTKIAANASRAANRTERRLRELAREAVAAHAAADAAEDELYGAGRGDELPPQEGGGSWSPRRRRERVAAALAQLEAEQAAEQAERDAQAAQFRARQQAGQRTGCSPAHAAVALAEENLARVIAERQAQLAALEEQYAAGQPRRGRSAGVEDYCRVRRAQDKLEKARERAAAAERKAGQAAGPGPVRNITDPDSRLMPTRNGFIQGYNAQNVTSADGLVIATRLTSDTTDMAWYEPMTVQAQQAAALIEANRPAGSRDDGDAPGSSGIGLVLADAGYCSEANLTCDGPDRLIATAKRRDLEGAARDQDGGAAGQDPGGPAVQDMRERLRTEDGIEAYRQRGHIAETPHGHIKHNMGFRQLTMRGKDKAAAEWTFACAIHNLLKALTAGYLTTQALAALAG